MDGGATLGVRRLGSHLGGHTVIGQVALESATVVLDPGIDREAPVEPALDDLCGAGQLDQLRTAPIWSGW